jgi:hypothetical protein
MVPIATLQRTIIEVAGMQLGASGRIKPMHYNDACILPHWDQFVFPLSSPPLPSKLHMYTHHVLSACVISHPLLKDGAFREVGRR